MISPASGGNREVIGKRIAIPAVGPTPGRTPMNVPKITPTVHHNRLIGSSAIPKAWRRVKIVSISSFLSSLSSVKKGFMLYQSINPLGREIYRSTLKQ
jgi:hypothetical protein